MAIENVRRVLLDSRGHVFQSDRDSNSGTVSVVDYVYDQGSTPLRFARAVDHLFSCRFCDAYPTLAINADTAVARTECPHPDGITSTFTVPLLSGKVIVSDDLRDVYTIPELIDGGFASYNSSLGEDQVNQAMAALGCAHGPVGNSCPDLFQTGPTSFVWAAPEYDEGNDELIIPEGWTSLGGIVTDYWAYCMADFEDWKSQGGDPDSDHAVRSCEVIDFPPGVYRFTNHYGEKGFDAHADGLVIFAHIELENPAEPLAAPTSE